MSQPAEKAPKRRVKSKPSGMQASEFYPPAAMLDIAKERTIDIAGVWASRFRWGTATLAQLAESCYMQGVNDTADALLVHAKYVKPERVEGGYEEVR